jgi:succinoglycan biosynthesis transport protein ExoP
MDFVRLYWLLRINLPQILIGAFAGSVVAAIVTVSTTPLFTATAQVFVSTPATALDITGLAQGSSFSQQRVKSYAKIINSPLTLEPVIEKLKIDDTFTEIAQRLKATVPLDTVLIDISYQDEDPLKAANIVNEIGLQFSNTASNIEFGDTSQGIKVTLVGYATPPTQPSSPKLRLNFGIGILLGGLVGLAFRLLIALFDSSVKNERQLNGERLLSTIVFDKIAVSKPLVSEISKYSPRTESFRQLRTNIIHAKKEDSDRNQVLLLTSSVPGEGKTTSSINLSYILAEADYKVLLIEADMRRPTASRYLKADISEFGLSDYLQSKHVGISNQTINKYTQKKTTDLFDTIVSGKLPVNPAELLGNGRLEPFLVKCREIYDFIVIDSPPLLPVTDAAIIAPMADEVLLFLKAGSTKENQFQASVTALQSVSASLLGVVFNMIPIGTRDYMNYGYQHGYVSPYKQPKYRSVTDGEYVYGSNAYYEKIIEESPYAPDIENLRRLKDLFDKK